MVVALAKKPMPQILLQRTSLTHYFQQVKDKMLWKNKTIQYPCKTYIKCNTNQEVELGGRVNDSNQEISNEKIRLKIVSQNSDSLQELECTEVSWLGQFDQTIDPHPVSKVSLPICQSNTSELAITPTHKSSTLFNMSFTLKQGNSTLRFKNISLLLISLCLFIYLFVSKLWTSYQVASW